MSKKPNYLVFCVDQMQSFAMGCNGNTQVKTPNLDSLAAEGTSFCRAYCANTTCMPSRASIFTGLTPKQHGCISNGVMLPESIPTIVEALSNHGYRTYGSGKFHLQSTNLTHTSEESAARWDSNELTKLPVPYYGFTETNFVGAHINRCYGEYKQWLDVVAPGTWDLYQSENAYATPVNHGSTWRMEVPVELHYNNYIGDTTIDFLNSVKDDENFFVWCSFPDPHAPFVACKPYSEMYNPADMIVNETWDYTEESLAHLEERRKTLYGNKPAFDKEILQEMQAQTYGMITHVDDNIGRVMDALKENNLDENTIVVFMADHGEYLGTHHLLQKHEWPYEELSRVPFIWKMPTGNAIKGNCEQVVSLLDFAPTVLELSGISQDELDARGQLGKAKPLGLPGRTLTSYLVDGVALTPTPAYIEFEEDWFDGPFYRDRIIVTEKYKLALFVNAGDGYLFDLEKDPHEKVNLFFEETYKDIKQDLSSKLLEHLIKTDRTDLKRVEAF
ncbi:MAG: sulfatase-like hydrolase/transferase [Lachnospiraceae bacterium]